MAEHYDVVVVGAGNAGFCAALAARDQGARVVMLERAPQSECGGNTRFAGGAMRIAYNGVDDLKRLMPELTDAEVARTDFGAYTRADFFDDMFRLTQHRTDPDLCEQLVTRSFPVVEWLRAKGIRFVPLYGRQAFEINGRFTFWGGMVIEAWGGGRGMIDRFTEIALKEGVAIRYETEATSLLFDGNAVGGVRVKERGTPGEIRGRSVVLASGGFESNAEWRARYLGPDWDLAKVRGTRYNMGEGMRMALDIGASPAGHWSGCHAVAWDINAPEYPEIGELYQKHSFPWSIMVNAHGRRFFDEGADFRNYTYAVNGKRILEQPGRFAWQIFDRKVLHFLRDEYRFRKTTKVTAQSLEELAEKLDGVDALGFLDEVRRYNAAVKTGIPFNPNVKDGRGTQGLAIAKSNWANTIDEPPFEAYQVGCAITYTYGGLRVAPQTAQVLDVSHRPIPGLYAAGEIVGGLFCTNYPGGSGLTAGAVFGQAAGAAAASRN